MLFSSLKLNSIVFAFPSLAKLSWKLWNSLTENTFEGKFIMYSSESKFPTILNSFMFENGRKYVGFWLFY